MVFVALPALQRSQRDTQRRNDLSRVDTSLVQYQTNNQGTNGGFNLPAGPNYFDAATGHTTGRRSAAKEFVHRYMNSGVDESEINTFQDPDGTLYNLYISENLSSSKSFSTHVGAAKLQSTGEKSYTIASDFDDHIIYIIPGARCNGGSVTVDTVRHFAVLYRLAGAGTYCIDDQWKE